eukprot:Rhum_TRINITY_DN14960_c26_g1::Rhum_TRINITY_DN14960_c26_g1_i1::g.130508::m.130508
MVVIKILSDSHPPSAKLLISLSLGDKVSKHSKSMGEKSGLKKLDVWGVEDQAAAKKEKDPTKLKLRALDKAKTFTQNNVGAEEFVYVKKAGWAPDAAAAKEKPAKKATDAPAPPAAAPVPPPPAAPAAPTPPAPPAA